MRIEQAGPRHAGEQSQDPEEERRPLWLQLAAEVICDGKRSLATMEAHKEYGVAKQQADHGDLPVRRLATLALGGKQ